MANKNVRQISVFLDGKQVEGTIKNIAGAFAEATNRLAKMVVGSEEYIAQLSQVQKYSAALAEHRQRIRGVEEANTAAAGSVNALQQEYQVATASLNNLEIGSVAYTEQLQRVQALEQNLSEVRRQQSAQNQAVAGSVNAMQKEYQEATIALNAMVVGSDEYEVQLKRVQELEATLTETRKKQQAQNTAVAGSVRALEEELQKERIILRDLVIGTKEYQEQLKKVQSLDDDLQKHQQALKGVGQGWSLAKAGVGNFIGVAAGAFAVDSLLGYGKQLYNTGVQMDSVAKKARTVFGEVLPQVDAAAAQNAASMGLTNSQYVAAAENIQDLLVPMGFQRDQAADISTQLVNLSGALAEWSNGTSTATEVSEILNKSLLGEREELKALGISISEADVQAQLAAKGFDKLTGKALEQAKAMATLDLILAKSTDAQAQFANGSESAIRTQAEAAAKIQNIIEKISAALLPTFSKLTQLAAGVADAIGFIIDPMAETEKASESLADQTKKTQMQFNGEIETLTKGNFTQGERAKLINEINSKYREYLPNLISEKAGIEEITAAQAAANKVFSQKIIYQSYQDEITKATKEGAAAVTAAYESEKKRQELIQKQQKPSPESADNANADQVLATQVKLLGAIRDEAQQTAQAAPGVANQITQIYDQLAAGMNTSLAELEKRFGVVTQTANANVSQAAQKEQDALKALIERTTEIRRELLSKQQNDEIELAIQSVERRYEVEINKALELERKGYEAATEQRKILELSKAEEIALVTREIAEKAREEQEKLLKEEAEKQAALAEEAKKAKEEAFQKDNEERLIQEEERLKFEADLKEFTNEALLSEREAEILALTEHYNTLLAIAEKYGYDTTVLKEAFAKEQADIEKAYAEKTAKEQAEAQQARLAALQSTFAAFGDFVTSTFDLLGGEGEKAAAFQKIATLAKIAFDTASAISSLTALSEANPANAVTFGAAGVAQFVSGLARIIANIAQAKKILSTAPVVKQQYKGRYLDVTGEDDRRNYSAQIIPPPQTGLLPDHPVLFQSQATNAPVLASERGREYFVSSESLRNPYIANLTRMIDNITITGGRGIAQFAAGGYNQTTTAAPSTAPALPTPGAGPDLRIIERNTAVMEALLAAINGGIIATIPDRTLTEIPGRINKINTASGGYLS